MKNRLLTIGLLGPLMLLASFTDPASANETREPNHIDDYSISPQEIAQAWDDEKLLAAQPIELEVEAENRITPTMQKLTQNDISEPTVIVDPVDPLSPLPRIRANGALVPSTVGRLVSLTPNGKESYCTASVVNSSTKNIIYTAAHCVYNKDTPENGVDGWHSNFVFIPAYHEKLVNNKRVPQTPFGQWTASHGSVYHGWTIYRDRQYDQAFMTLDANNNGNMLQDLTGANGLSYNEPTPQVLMNVWGYPRAGRYESEKWRPHVCSHTMQASSAAVLNGVRMACDMTRGSSGGPWIKGRATANYGYIVAVTSGRPLSERNYIHGAPNTEKTEVLYIHREELS